MINMYHQHVPANGHRLLSKNIKVTLMLIIVAICELSSIAGHDFCAHSSASRRFRRADHVLKLETQAQRAAADPSLNSQMPRNQVEEQVIIDETSFEQLRDESRTTGALSECSKSTSGSRSSGSVSTNNNNNKLTVDGCTDLKTIETAVFIDQALDGKFDGLSGGLVDLNKLVLSIMNQVQYLFKYSSLKIPIKIKLVLIEHLKDIERSGNQVPRTERGDIDAYLSNFCNWQYDRLQQNKRLWWDHAILLSG